jgi:hypothetical protein
MDKLAWIQANQLVDGLACERNAGSSGREEILAALGGELLAGSGFEHEQPEPSFEDKEVS